MNTMKASMNFRDASDARCEIALSIHEFQMAAHSIPRGELQRRFYAQRIRGLRKAYRIIRQAMTETFWED
jgi:hypothetical protein